MTSLRISHRELASVLADPQSYVDALVSHSDERSGGWSYDRLSVVKIQQFHKGADVRRLSREIPVIANNVGFVDSARIRRAQERLLSYVEWFQEAQPLRSRSQIRLAFQIVPNVMLGGEVTRFDTLNNGYRGILLQEPPEDWASVYPQMPLVQMALADRFARPADEIEVGYQSLDNHRISTRTYSSSVMQAAFEGVRAVAARIWSDYSRRISA